jgi:glycosyltransferase involved in cell wall biosynthesis
MKPPLRILIANSGRRWIGEVGHCAQLYEALTALGHHVLLACRRGSALEEHAAKQGWNRIVLEFSSRPRYSDWKDIQQLEQRIREERIELFHAHRGKDHWVGVVVSRRCAIPLVRTRHVVTPVDRHFFNRWLYSEGMEGLISVSSAVEAGLGGLVDAPRLRTVIHSAVDQEKFSPLHRSEVWRRGEGGGVAGEAPNEHERLWIGLIGRIQRVKGQRPFIDAVGPVAKEFPEAQVLIAGRKGESYRRIFRQRARDLGFDPMQMHVEGFLDDLPTAMASLDIGVVASLGSEGMSRVTLEYMASGVPVVATRVGAIPELLERQGEEPLGLIVPPDDPAAMTGALLLLARDPERRRRMAERGLEAVRARHTVEAWAEATVDVYRRVMAAAR